MIVNDTLISDRIIINFEPYIYKPPANKGYSISRNMKSIVKGTFSKDLSSSLHPETTTTISDFDRVILNVLNTQPPLEHHRAIARPCRPAHLVLATTSKVQRRRNVGLSDAENI
ncbi:hypothetical protein ElyMa_001478900 [Elysia marginata]|uniref:Uncharacterized protein n=1 Tax=Elysia marginata TaxID=1093978 RepID=A0AAV4J7Y3_9GAST|nr:hypothetical protein ElyMa_001478900 [Elysia marginata]